MDEDNEKSDESIQVRLQFDHRQGHLNEPGEDTHNLKTGDRSRVQSMNHRVEWLLK